MIEYAKNGKYDHPNYRAISGVLMDALRSIQIALVERVFLLRLLYRRTENVIVQFLQFEHGSLRDRSIAVNMFLLIRHEKEDRLQHVTRDVKRRHQSVKWEYGRMDSAKNENEVDDNSIQPNDVHRLKNPRVTIVGARS
jgi:hypothetical protein